MKNSDWNLTLRSSVRLVLLIFTLMPTLLGAKSFFTIEQTAGEVLATGPNGIFEVKRGDQLNDFQNIMNDKKGSVTFSDSEGRKYYLTGEAQLSLLNNVIELQKGYLWIQSTYKKNPLIVTTANSLITLLEGEVIILFDVQQGKTQVLSLKNNCLVSNILEKEIQEKVGVGEFTFIHPSYNNGRPRPPTPVSYDSFQQLSALFNHLPVYQKPTKERSLPPEKEMALRANYDTIVKQKGESETLFLKEKPVKVHLNLKKLYRETVDDVKHDIKKMQKPLSSQKSTTKVKIFGLKSKRSSPPPLTPLKTDTQPETHSQDNGKELQKRREQQEVHKLIEELSNKP